MPTAKEKFCVSCKHSKNQQGANIFDVSGSFINAFPAQVFLSLWCFLINGQECLTLNNWGAVCYATDTQIFNRNNNLVPAEYRGFVVEAGLLGPMGGEIRPLGHLQRRRIGVGAALTFLLMLFFGPRAAKSFFTLQPLTLGMRQAIYVIILTVATPASVSPRTMIGIPGRPGSPRA